MLRNKKTVIIVLSFVAVFVVVGTIVIIRGTTGSSTQQGEDGDKESVSSDQRDPSTSSGQSLPADFPEDFPIYPEAKIESAFTSKGDEVKAMSVIWMASDSLDSVSAYYTSELARAGWIVNSTLEDESSVTLSFEKAGEQGFIGIGKQDDGFVIISVTIGASFERPTI